MSAGSDLSRLSLSSSELSYALFFPFLLSLSLSFPFFSSPFLTSLRSLADFELLSAREENRESVHFDDVHCAMIAEMIKIRKKGLFSLGIIGRRRCRDYDATAKVSLLFEHYLIVSKLGNLKYGGKKVVETRQVFPSKNFVYEAR